MTEYYYYYIYVRVFRVVKRTKYTFVLYSLYVVSFSLITYVHIENRTIQAVRALTRISTRS